MKHSLLMCAVLLSAICLHAQERVDLSVPQPMTLSGYHIASLNLDWDNASITINLKGTNGEPKTCGYSGATATTLMTALNKVNLATRSLNQRVFDRLIADGCLVGTVAGTVP